MASTTIYNNQLHPPVIVAGDPNDKVKEAVRIFGQEENRFGKNTIKHELNMKRTEVTKTTMFTASS